MAFYVGDGDPNSGPHVDVISAVTHQNLSSPDMQILIWKVHIRIWASASLKIFLNMTGAVAYNHTMSKRLGYYPVTAFSVCLVLVTYKRQCSSKIPISQVHALRTFQTMLAWLLRETSDWKWLHKNQGCVQRLSWHQTTAWLLKFVSLIMLLLLWNDSKD